MELRIFVQRCTFLIIILALTSPAQQKDFPVGVFLSGGKDFTRFENYWQIKEMGANMVVQWAEKGNPGKSNLDSLAQFDYVIAWNGNSNDYIHHYTSGMYSKWEAEWGTGGFRAGVKHETGESGTHLGKNGWLSKPGQSYKNKSLLSGPFYQQKKNYILTYYYNKPVYYTAQYNIALKKVPQRNIPVCSLVVTYTYLDNNNVRKEAVLGSPRVVTSAALSDGKIHGIKINYDYQAVTDEKRHEGDGFLYGVQFKVILLNEGISLFVDNVEVYDNSIWKDFQDDPQKVSRLILDYDQSFKNANPRFYDRLQYWFSRDEPDMIDFIGSYFVVDSILKANGRKKLITEFNSSYDRLDINWDSMIKRWSEGTKADKLLVDYYPYKGDLDSTPLEMFYYQRILQECYLYHPNFFYSIQAFGWKNFTNPEKWKWWRQPSPAELNIALMMPLAHGAKGLIFWKYYSNGEWRKDSFSDDRIMEMDLVVWDKNKNEYVPTALWHKVKNDIAPRLKGVLGKTLLDLNYTGMNSSSHSFEPAAPVNGFNYLDFTRHSSRGNEKYFDYHAGLFTKKDDAEDRYFFVVNTNPSVRSSYSINLKSPDTRYKNFRVKNVEGGLDTTFSSKLSFILNYPPGEGYLYRITPVVKYGGKLDFDESIDSDENLKGELFISPGKTLTINSRFNIYDNLVINSGGKLVINSGGSINVYYGKIINNGLISGNIENIKYRETGNKLAKELTKPDK